MPNEGMVKLKNENMHVKEVLPKIFDGRVIRIVYIHESSPTLAVTRFVGIT